VGRSGTPGVPAGGLSGRQPLRSSEWRVSIRSPSTVPPSPREPLHKSGGSRAGSREAQSRNDDES
jgi:hypothetical protein